MIVLPGESIGVRKWILPRAILVAVALSAWSAVVGQDPPNLFAPQDFEKRQKQEAETVQKRLMQDSEAIQKQVQQSSADARKEAADPSAARLRKLRTERRDTLHLLVDNAREGYRAGKAPLADLLDVSTALQASELELLEKHAERLAALERFVKLAEQIEQAAQRRVTAGKGERSELLRAKAYGLSVQDRLEQERNRGRLPPEELKVLSALVEARKSTFLKVKALSEGASPGGEADKLFDAGAKLRQGQAELALAKGQHEEALSYALGACVYFRHAMTAMESLFEVGLLTLDRMLEAQTRFEDAYLRLLLAYRVFGVEGKVIPLPDDESTLK